MKTKNFKHGQYSYKAYYKPVGKGYEVGFTQGTKVLFVGNFLHAKEANAWWTEMNRHLKTFPKKYWITPKAPRSFYHKFFTNFLYKHYYSWLDKSFTKYTRKYQTEFNKNERQYKQIKKQKAWKPSEKVTFKNAG